MNIHSYINQLIQFVETRDFAGYDPYDALNSPIVRALSLDHKYGRICWIQFFRRCPINFRPLLDLKPGHNAKGIGLFLGGYTRLYKLNQASETLEKIDYLINLLKSLRSEGYSGNCWGYNFDWQSRIFFVPKGTPSIVCSSFVGHALMDAWEATRNQDALDLALPIKDFFLNDLNRTKEGDSFCFSYTPLDQSTVHNANLLGASLLIRLHKYTGDQQLYDMAMSSLSYSMKYQNSDGSWYYGNSRVQRWIDSFHTGFNLEAIRHFFRMGQALGYKDAYNEGVSYYANNFFLQDGTPKYYHNRIYPIDIHSPAEAVVFFSGEGTKYSDLTRRVLSWMLENMWHKKKGYFFFRKGRYFTNKIPYMRWSQAWGFHALTTFLINQNHK